MTSAAAATPAAPIAPAIPDILHEHFEESGFLAIQRRALLFSVVPLRALRRLDGRRDAHRDALRIGGDEACAMAVSLLEGDDPWLLAEAARVWLEQSREEPAGMRARIEAADEARWPSWREALRAADDTAVERVLPAAQVPVGPVLLALAVDARGWRGTLAPALAQAAARDTNDAVRAAFARHTRDAAAATALLDDASEDVRRRALWSLGRSDANAALARARRDAAAAAPDPFTLRVLGLLGGRADGERLLALVGDPALGPAALAALRDLAQPVHATALLPWLEAKDEAVATMAALAFESLLGTVPEQGPSRPLPDGMTPASAHARERLETLERNACQLAGAPLPWRGESADEPLEFLWRRAPAGGADLTWLAREVPAGFFTGSPDPEMLPGA